jgi:hypothetical protein
VDHQPQHAKLGPAEPAATAGLSARGGAARRRLLPAPPAAGRARLGALRTQQRRRWPQLEPPPDARALRVAGKAARAGGPLARGLRPLWRPRRRAVSWPVPSSSASWPVPSSSAS